MNNRIKAGRKNCFVHLKNDQRPRNRDEKKNQKNNLNCTPVNSMNE